MNIYTKSKILGRSKILRQKDVGKGFTLIELIVVIAIIGLIASVVLTSLGVSRMRAEISKVLTDYKSVANAIELYRQAHNGIYPGDIDDPAEIQDLVQNNAPLSEYIKQVPSLSMAVTLDGKILYNLNNPDTSEIRYWCGENETAQDYVLYFIPTTAAVDSGLFKPIFSGTIGYGGSEISNLLCIPVNQD